MTSSPATAPHRAHPAVIPARASTLPGTAPRAGGAWGNAADEPAPPVYLIPTLIGALAILAATIAIPPMISGDTWFWPTVEVVMVIWLVGVGARLARVPAVGAILLQLVGASVALTALFTTGGIGGVIPNGAVIGEAGELLTGAWDQIRTTVSPAPASTELAFLICLSVGTTALIVDILIAVCRAPALVALPLLCVFSVPASIDLSMLPWEAFAAPAMLYAMLLVASGLTGRRLDAGAGLAQVVSGVALAAVATVIALVVAGSVTGVGTAGRLPRSASGPSSGVGLSAFASLQGNLQRSDPVDMFTVTGLTEPQYLRTVGLQKWIPGKGFDVDQLTDGRLPNDLLPAAQQPITVTALAYRDLYLPIYSGTTRVDGADPGWSYDDALQSIHRPEPVTPAPYQVDAVAAAHTADELRADTVTPGGVLTETGELAAEAIAQATAVTAAATTAFDKADALRRYFTDPANGFTYSLTVPPGTSGDPLVDFLTNKQGYCQQYASAMAIMLRAVGVPARVAMGFTQGTRQADGSYLISSNDAHAWVEVLFDKSGWVRFDPTPLGGGRGGQQGFTEEGGAAASAQSIPSEEVPSPGAVNEPTARDGGPTALPSQGAAGAGSTDESAVPPGWWLALAILALVAAAAAGPTVVRRRRRDRRLAEADAGGPGAAAAAWREIEDLAVDHGVGLNPAESARATANRLAKAAHLSTQGRTELRELVTSVERGWYADADASSGDSSDDGDSADSARSAGGTTATLVRPAATDRLGAATRTMAAELQHHIPLTALDRLIPRSVRPSWWRD